MLDDMDGVQIGRRVRAVRMRLGLRQLDVAERAGVSHDLVSRIERGRLDALQQRTLRDVLGALEMELAQEVRWRGGDVDRLVDEGHASLVERICALLVAAGWVVLPEVSFSVYGERGSIDVLAWHPGQRLLLVVEVKTSLQSMEELLRRHDVKVRLAPRLAGERFGWTARGVARLLVLPDDSTPRRRVARHAAMLQASYPVRGREVGAWLRNPGATRGMLIFLSPSYGERLRRGPVTRRRVRKPGAAAPVAVVGSESAVGPALASQGPAAGSSAASGASGLPTEEPVAVVDTASDLPVPPASSG